MSSGALDKFIKALFQVAWLDDVISPGEVQALSTTLRRLGLPLPEVICLMDQHLCEKPQGEPVKPDELFGDRSTQMEALQSLMNVCMADGALQPEEMGYLEGLIIRMGVTRSELETLRKNAMPS